MLEKAASTTTVKPSSDQCGSDNDVSPREILCGGKKEALRSPPRLLYLMAAESLMLAQTDKLSRRPQ
jgi:hypothetical protein